MRSSSPDKTNRKDAILRAAAALCAQHGIAETNLRQIARGAGISSGTLHYHFPSKEELIESMILRAVEPMGNQAAQIARGAGGAFEQLQGIVDLCFRLFDEDWDFYCVALLLGDSVQKRVGGRFPTTTAAIEQVIENGQRLGEVRDGDCRLLAIQCHGLIMRVARARVFGELEPPLRQFAGPVSDSMRRILDAGFRISS